MHTTQYTHTYGTVRYGNLLIKYYLFVRLFTFAAKIMKNGEAGTPRSANAYFSDEIVI